MAFIENEVTKTILARKSIRKYKDRQLTADELETVLTCGFFAPSGLNLQQWRAIVLQDAELMREINEKTAQAMQKAPGFPDKMRERAADPDFSVFFGAPTCIFVAYPPDRGDVNACLMAENMAVAAQSIGLGSCFSGSVMMFLTTPEGAEYMKRLNVPEGWRIGFGLMLGCPDEAPEAKPRDLTKYEII